MIAGLYGKSMFCKKPPNCLPKWLYHFAFPPATNEGSCCSTSLSAFSVVSLLDFSHSHRCAVVSHYYYYFLIYLFWLRWVFVAACGLTLVAASRGYSSLRCVSFSLWWLLLLWSTGSRCAGFSSCGTQAQ